ERLFEHPRAPHAFRFELRDEPAELLLVPGEQRLERVGFGAERRVPLLGLHTLRALPLEAIADPSAEGSAEHEAHRPGRSRADHGTGPETDGLMLRRAVLLGRPTRRRDRGGDRGHQQLLAHCSRSSTPHAPAGTWVIQASGSAQPLRDSVEWMLHSVELWRAGEPLRAAPSAKPGAHQTALARAHRSIDIRVGPR